MSDGPIGELPNTDSMVSEQPLKLIEYPPNAFFAFAMSPPPVSGGPPASRVPRVLLPQVRGTGNKKPHPWGPAAERKIPPTGTGGTRRQRPKAGMTSRANQRSCSLNSFGGMPSAQWIMKCSSPGYFASMDLMPSMTCDGGPTNHAFCAIPSLSVGTRAGAPGIPQLRPCSSAYRTNPNGANHL